MYPFAKQHKIINVKKDVLAPQKGQTYLPEALAACSCYCFHNLIMSILKPLSPPVWVQGTFTQRGPKGRKGRVVIGGLLYFTLILYFIWNVRL